MLNVLKSWIRVISFRLPSQVFEFALQRLLIHVAVDFMIHFDHRCKRALAKAGNRSNRILPSVVLSAILSAHVFIGVVEP